LSTEIPENLETFVCAHELGHAIKHPDMNTPFLKTYTLFSTDKIEREASTFAVELLLTDRLLHEYKGYCISTISKMAGIPDRLIELKQINH
jgi:Zn-dependent peptidase ImmA (M78 family)